MKAALASLVGVVALVVGTVLVVVGSDDASCPPLTSSGGGLAGHDPQVAAAIRQVAGEVGASQRALLAAFEAALVESGMRNLAHGDRDSLGVFQQRASWGPTAQRLDPAWAAGAFFLGANGHAGALEWDARLSPQVTAGTLAQAVQVSAYPERYDEREVDARLLLFGGTRAVAEEPAVEPAAWGGHTNGLIPPAALASIPGHPGVSLRPDAAHAAAALIAAAAADGVQLIPGGGYRDYHTQVRLRSEKGRWAAQPGTSNHGWGLAIDWWAMSFDSPGFAWLQANASRYGWNHPDWAGPYGSLPEPWHWEYSGTATAVAACAPGLAGSPVQTPASSPRRTPIPPLHSP